MSVPSETLITLLPLLLEYFLKNTLYRNLLILLYVEPPYMAHINASMSLMSDSEHCRS